MSAPRIIRRAFFPLVLSFGVLAPGCSEDDSAPTAPEADPYVQATTPAKAAERFVETYEAQDLASYAGNLTTDFRYIFSSQSDPVLVAEYGATWGIADEDSSARHLFQGFVNDQSDYMAGARTIVATTPFFQVLEDPSHTDSTSHYALVAIPRLQFEITLENDTGFNVDAPFNLYVVRGDVARLDGNQPSDTSRWYIRRIDDLTPSITLRRRTFPGAASSWGRIRAAYASPRIAVVH